MRGKNPVEATILGRGSPFRADTGAGPCERFQVGCSRLFTKAWGATPRRVSGYCIQRVTRRADYLKSVHPNTLVSYALPVKGYRKPRQTGDTITVSPRLEKERRSMAASPMSHSDYHSIVDMLADHSGRLDSIEEILKGHSGRLDRIDGRLDRIEATLGKHRIILENIANSLVALHNKMLGPGT